MDQLLSTFLEIAKLTIPAFVIYFTIQKITKNQLNSVVSLKNLEFRQQQTDKILPLKLQAYERLTLMLSRTRLGNLLNRLELQGLSIDQVKTLILVSVKQELDHNSSQQIYISEKLWEVVNMAIERGVQMMDELSQNNQIKTTQDFVQVLYRADAEQGKLIYDIGQAAIKEEVNVLLK